MEMKDIYLHKVEQGCSPYLLAPQLIELLSQCMFVDSRLLEDSDVPTPIKLAMVMDYIYECLSQSFGELTGYYDDQNIPSEEDEDNPNILPFIRENK